MLNTSTRTAFDETHALFRDQVRKFLDREVAPHIDRWEADGITDRGIWTKCGAAGLLCPTLPEAYGGLGLSYLYNAVIDEEVAYLGANLGIGLQSDICADYILAYGSEAQKRDLLPKMISGEVVTAIAMTEPQTGSDLQAVRTTAIRKGDDFVINGNKTYITNGQLADIIIVVAKTDPNAGGKGISLILVESTRDGFSRGRNLDKIGQHAADTSELFFSDVRVPASNILGAEGRGFAHLMNQLPQERLGIAIASQAQAQRAFDEAVKFTKDRKAFGASVIDFQHTRFQLADMATQLQVGWAHLDWALKRHVAGDLTTIEASAAKLFHSEMANKLCDMALQMHGGAGYMNEFPIARLWRDLRVARIYGGTSEIMKEVISRGF